MVLGTFSKASGPPDPYPPWQLGGQLRGRPLLLAPTQPSARAGLANSFPVGPHPAQKSKKVCFSRSYGSHSMVQ